MPLVVLLLLLLPLSLFPLLREVSLLLHHRGSRSWHRYKRRQRRRPTADTLRCAAGRALVYDTPGLTAFGAEDCHPGPAPACRCLLRAAGVALGPPAHPPPVRALSARSSAALLLLLLVGCWVHGLGLW